MHMTTTDTRAQTIARRVTDTKVHQKTIRYRPEDTTQLAVTFATIPIAKTITQFVIRASEKGPIAISKTRRMTRPMIRHTAAVRQMTMNSHDSNGNA
jgi:hypothetical protein